jgi:hypothetical protein
MSNIDFSLLCCNSRLNRFGNVDIHLMRVWLFKQKVQGESPAYIRDQLGHHSIKVTVDICGHLAPEGNKGAVDRLDDATRRKPGATRKDKELTTNG